MTGSRLSITTGKQLRRPAYHHALPRTRSTTQQPRTCGPSPRQWLRMSELSHPASSSASARIGIGEKSRDSYIDWARATTVDVRQSALYEIELLGSPNKSRSR